MRAAVRTIDPGEWPADPPTAAAKEKLVSLIFETLVRLDGEGQLLPGLALSWEHDSSNRQWRLRLRPDVKFDDGSTMTSEVVAAALRSASPGWRIGTYADRLTIDCELPAPDLPYVLTEVSKSVVLRGENGRLSGTGPFRLQRWEPGRLAVLAANQGYWEGRPFLESIMIEMGRSLRDQLLDLELNKADFVEIGPNDARRMAQRNTRIWSSSPNTLVALAFERGRQAVEDARVREAIAFSVDRAAMHTVLLQKQGEPAAAVLPQYLSGYAFLFLASTDVPKARQLVAGLGQGLRPLLLSCDPGDPLGRAISERIAVNAREAGLTVQVSTQPLGIDMRLVRLPIRGQLPAQALAGVISAFHLSDLWPLAQNESVEALYACERSILESYRLIPLFHLPEYFGSTTRLKSWTTPGVGKSSKWHFDDFWLDAEKP